ncbi:MAG: hypothetical protein HOL01_14380 [Planctomycetaceae bacterium]|nr:hypothetical protein [Planctomycetaceae bacterium]MBT6487098.1 hypothetical protein [Planctomycetaceae bacterium]MBT6495732.1 hypothetical protein [Planctomycetaceae bacterium]
MQYRHSPNTAENQRNPAKRILNSLMLILLSRLLRLVGWGAVVGLPAMVLTPRRLGRLVREYPIIASTICLAFLVGVAFWNEGNRPQPGEFEIESIENIGEPNELIAASNPSLNNAASSRRDSSFDVVKSTAAVNTRQSARSDSNSNVRAEQARLEKTQARTQSNDESRIVWLTGRIEEVSTGEAATPVRDANRFPSNNRR